MEHLPKGFKRAPKPDSLFFYKKGSKPDKTKPIVIWELKTPAENQLPKVEKEAKRKLKKIKKQLKREGWDSSNIHTIVTTITALGFVPKNFINTL